MEKENDEKIKETGMYLRELRKKTGESIFKVSKQLGFSGNYLSLIERGKQIPSRSVLKTLANYYDISFIQLLDAYDKLDLEETKLYLDLPILREVLLRLTRIENISHEQKEKVLKNIYNFINNELKTLEEENEKY